MVSKADKKKAKRLRRAMKLAGWWQGGAHGTIGWQGEASHQELESVTCAVPVEDSLWPNCTMDRGLLLLPCGLLILTSTGLDVFIADKTSAGEDEEPTRQPEQQEEPSVHAAIGPQTILNRYGACY